MNNWPKLNSEPPKLPSAVPKKKLLTSSMHFNLKITKQKRRKVFVTCKAGHLLDNNFRLDNFDMTHSLVFISKTSHQNL